MARLAILLGSGNAVIAIVCGAFGAHALSHSLSNKMLSIFHTAVDYHFYHALGLIIIGILMTQYKSAQLLKFSTVLMQLGIIIFCGSLYLLSVTGIKWLGMITPIGGLAFIVAWISVLLAFLKKN